MRHLLYILFCLCCFSCAQKEQRLDATESISTQASPEALEEEAAAADAEATTEYKENVTIASNLVIEQQLQEALNLIVLNNQLDVNQDLKTALEESIAQKVEKYTVDHALDVIKVTTKQVLEQREINNQQHVMFSFEALDKNQDTLRGQAKAVITLNSVNIDGQDYTDYQVYFKKIVVE